MTPYRSLTRERAESMKLTYHLKRGKEPEREVTLDEYLEAVRGSCDMQAMFGTEDHVPKMFMGGGMTGSIGGEDEGRLV